MVKSGEQPRVEVSVVTAAEKGGAWYGYDLPPQFNEILIYGNREGLRWLAGRILAVAERAPGTHTHLDRDTHAPLYASTDDWWLTVGVDEEVV
jgi:hypothetical protein